MGSTLLENFNEKAKKSKVAGTNSEAEFDVAYSTGFLAMDFINGTTIHVESKERNFSYTSAGIVDGSCNTIICRSGSGKSTLLMQICGNIVRPFIEKEMDTMLLIDDLEGSLPQVRKEFLLGLSQEQLDKYVESRNTGITTENVFQIQKDNKYPEAKVNFIGDADNDVSGNQVNGTIEISGTASDKDHMLTGLRLEYQTSTTGANNSWTGTDASGSSGSDHWTPFNGTNQNGSDSYNSWKFNVDTTVFEDETYVRFRAVATDEAGNSGNSGTATAAFNDAEGYIQTVHISQKT